MLPKVYYFLSLFMFCFVLFAHSYLTFLYNIPVWLTIFLFMSVLAELLIRLSPVSFIVESGGQEEICSKESLRSI